ncbi:MAG TPA: pyridoxal-phosphate dependent enzyme [Anaerolineae bacterium]|nr:pyridoxal-phosphate dependent enzyme [Anaerolineae bacterium]HQI86682.1 pyridoxal-phosphate dependent enzyme [Anaerolineae bacterium]HQK13428.1 pyridoxal-phosphate dependent enzyme [Anaerolineae bacterium]
MEVRYDYDRIRRLWPDILRQRPFTMWRYRELLPVRRDDFQITMGEGGTALLRANNLGMMLGAPNLFIKDERQNPTNSFKDRQAAMVISMMKEAGITELVVASTGNVAISYSAYSAHAGIKLWTFLPSLVPPEKMREIAIYGSEVVKVTANYDVAKKVAAEFAEHRGILVDRGIRNTGTRESMKTVAFEVAEQLAAQLGPPQPGVPWRTPDWYIQAVSGGMGPVGFWKGYEEMYQMGLINRLPKLAMIQAEGCAPMVNSFRKKLPVAEVVTEPATRVITIATGAPGPAYEYLYRVVQEHGGIFESVTDEETFRALHILAKMEGLSMEPAAAAAFAGLFKLLNMGIINRNDTVVVCCSGHTFPVEKFLLEEDWLKVVPAGPEALETPPPEAVAQAPVTSTSFLGALDQLDKRVRQIAIVEDNVEAARLLRRILQTHGEFQIVEAHTGKEGLTLIRETHPDLILLDLMMPDMDGFAVIDHLKADLRLKDIPVIVITAKELNLKDRQRLQGQIQMLLQKGSFMDEDLLQEINALLGKGNEDK